MTRRVLEHAPTGVVAVAVVCLSLADGAYFLTARGILGIAVWWAIILGLGLALLPFARPTRDAYVSGGLLAALAVLAGVSILWSTSPDRSFLEFDRVAIYLGVFILAVLTGTRGNVARWADGLALGIAAVGLLALLSRLFMGLIPGSETTTSIPNAASRLAYPFGYWNALGMLLAIGLPLLLRTAVNARTPLGRGVAVAVVPALSSAIFLTSSRGAVGAGLVGVAALLALARPRAAVLWATGCAGGASLLLVAVLTTNDALVDRPLRAIEAAAAQGRQFALVAVVVCIVTGAVYVGGHALARARGWGARVPRPGTAAKVALGALAVVALVAVVATANPGQLAQSFKQPGFGAGGRPGTTGHLASATGGGRYQFWSAAVDQFEANPVVGNGAGAYQAWWAAHPRFPYFVKDAHSLYLETLGELGLVGFLLLIGALGFPLVTGLRRLRGRDGPDRLVTASLCAAVFAWAFAVAIDWMWEMTLVTGVAIVCLGLLAGPATAPRAAPGRAAEPPPVRARRGSRSFGLGVAVIAAAWLVICAQASPLLSEMRLEDSRAAFRQGDYLAAGRAARGARTLQPWAAAPYQQLALVEERRGRLPQAHGYIEAAIARQPNDFVLWEDAARIEAAAGKSREARESTLRSRDLNPRLTASATVAP